MNSHGSLSRELQRQLDQVIAEYLQDVAAGNESDRDELTTRHPELAKHLRSFFDAQDQRQTSGSAAETAPPDDPREAETLLLGNPPDATDAETLCATGPTLSPGAVEGRHFGDYELLEEIARGGMGVVFRARHTKLNRPVALKMILSSHLAGDVEIQRFQAEAEAAAKLDHPGIVPIYEVGVHAGQHFFSMGLVEGGSLKRLVDDGPLGNRAAAEVTRSIADAVAYAHSRNIVHRDLKPANVLLDEENRPKVTDFGLAKDVDRDEGLTTSGQIMGTPGYMPPEQAAGRTAEIGPLADVYSIGAILYFLLTRQPPFRCESVMETLQRVLDTEPASPRTHNPRVDLDLETICLKCLEKDPARRYASAAELAEELGRYLEGRPIKARPVGQFERSVRWCRRNPLIAGLATSAVVALVAGVCTSTYFAVRARAEATLAKSNGGLAEKRRQEADEARETAEESEREAQRALARSRVSLAEAFYRDTDTLAMLRELEQVPQQHRDRNWHYLRGRADPSILSIDKAFRFAASIPNSGGKFVVSGSGGLFVMDGTTGALEPLEWTPDPKGVYDGRYPNDVNDTGTIYAGINRANGSVEAWDLNTRKRIANWSAGGRPPIYFDASDRLYLAHADRTELRDLRTGKVLGTRRGFHLRAVAPTTGILIGNGNGGVIGLKSLDGEPLFRAAGIGGALPIACSPDGRYAFLLMPGESVRVLNVHPNGPSVRSELRRIPTTIASQFARVFSTARGTSVLAVGTEGVAVPAQVWDRATGLPVHSVLGLDRATQEPAFDPETGLLAAPYGTGVKVWRLSIDQEESVWPGGLQNFAFTADGRTWRSSAGGKRLSLTSLDSPGDVAYDPAGNFALVAVARDANVACLAPWANAALLVVKGAPDAVETMKIPYYRTERSLDVSPNGRYATIMGYKGRFTIFDLANGKKILDRRLGGGGKGEGNFTAFLGNDRVLALRMRVKNTDYTMHACTPIGTDPVDRVLPFAVESLAVSPDDRVVAFGCGDKHVRFLDTKTFEPVGEPLRVHDREVTAVRFHPSHPIIATASADLTVRLWNWRTGEQLGERLGPTSAPRALDFSPDGTRLGCLDRALRVWLIDDVLAAQ